MEFIGSAKETRNGVWLNGYLTPEGIEAINRKSTNGFVRIKIGKMNKPSNKGYTHYIAIDDYTPEGQQNQQRPQYQHKYPQADNPRNQNTDLSDNYGPVGQDDIPF